MKKTGNTKYWQGCEGTKGLTHCGWQYGTGKSVAVAPTTEKDF